MVSACTFLPFAATTDMSLAADPMEGLLPRALFFLLTRTGGANSGMLADSTR